MKKLTLFLVFGFIFFKAQGIFGQPCVVFAKIKSDPKDSISLAIAESGSIFSISEKLYLLNSNLHLNRTISVKKYLLSLIKDGFFAEDVAILNIIDHSKLNIIIESDSAFKLEYRKETEKIKNEILNDPTAISIEEIFRIDQDTRAEGKIARDYAYMGKMDSLNQISILKILLNDPTPTLYYKSQQQLYIILLHVCRYMNNDLFNKLDKILIRKVMDKNFSAVSYSFIVDERLKVNKSVDYPFYNIMDKIKVDQSAQDKINKRKCEINAF